MSYRGGAALSWQSDYGQFYLVDGDDTCFVAPVEIPPEVSSRRWQRQSSSGLVVYTGDCLQQVIEVRIFGAPREADAIEWRSGNPWSQTELASATFPSSSFAVSSPSTSGTEHYGPIFRVDACEMRVRIQWMEFPGVRDDSKPILPDVIRLDLWPA